MCSHERSNHQLRDLTFCVLLRARCINVLCAGSAFDNSSTFSSGRFAPRLHLPEPVRIMRIASLAPCQASFLEAAATDLRRQSQGRNGLRRPPFPPLGLTAKYRSGSKSLRCFSNSSPSMKVARCSMSTADTPTFAKCACQVFTTAMTRTTSSAASEGERAKGRRPRIRTWHCPRWSRGLVRHS